MNEMMDVKAIKPVAAATDKKYMGMLDEYSRPINPWRIVPTYGVADISDLSEIKSLFRKFGIVVVRRAYNPKEAMSFYELGKKFTGLADIDVMRVAHQAKKPFFGGTPALVDPQFWPFVTHPSMKSIVKEIFGNAPSVEIGTSMAAHYSARGLHRDFPTWFQDPANSYNLENGANTVLRVLTYLSQTGMPAGTFGFIPFSHRKDLFNQQAARCGIKRPFEWYDTHRQLARLALETSSGAEVEEMDSHIMWVHLEAGDALLLDARMQHGGDYIVGPRYLFVMSFGTEDLKTKTQLRKRWSIPLQKCELAYYEFLNTQGLCSEQLLEDCRRASQRPQVKKPQPAAPQAMGM